MELQHQIIFIGSHLRNSLWRTKLIAINIHLDDSFHVCLPSKSLKCQTLTSVNQFAPTCTSSILLAFNISRFQFVTHVNSVSMSPIIFGAKLFLLFPIQDIGASNIQDVKINQNSQILLDIHQYDVDIKLLSQFRFSTCQS